MRPDNECPDCGKAMIRRADGEGFICLDCVTDRTAMKRLDDFAHAPIPESQRIDNPAAEARRLLAAKRQ